MSFVSRISKEKASMAEVIKPYPEIARGISIISEYVMRSDDLGLSLSERELIATFVSDLNKCDYAARTHQASAEALGANPALFSKILQDIDLAPVNEKLKPVLHYVKKLTLSPEKMTQTDVNMVFDAGWDEKDFHFAVMVCGLFNLYNRMLAAYGISNSHEHMQKAGRALAKSGYSHVAKVADKAS